MCVNVSGCVCLLSSLEFASIASCIKAFTLGWVPLENMKERRVLWPKKLGKRRTIDSK